MSIQSTRGAKNNGNVNSSPLSSSGSSPNTGTNSSTNSGGSNASGNNGLRRFVSKNSKSTTNAESDTDPSTTDALTDLLASSCGKTVVATVASGARYQGVLVTADVSSTATSSMSVVLAHPSLVSRSLINEKSNVDEKLPEKLIIQSKDLIDVEVSTSVADNKDSKDVKESKDLKQPQKESKDKEQKETKTTPEILSEKPVSKPVDVVKPISYSELVKKSTQPSVQSTERKLNAVRLDENPKVKPATEAQPPTSSDSSSKFKTDRDISAGFKFKEREFQMWQPDEGSEEITLEDTTASSGQWDQFKVNEEKFGVESSYDEHLYTTRVNTSAKDYNERLQRAQRIAREIEGLSTTDLHVLEERGTTVDDSGMDEEDKYSGVLAETNSSKSDAVAKLENKIDTRGSELMAALRKGSTSAVTRSGPYISEQKPLIPENGKYTTPGQRAAHYHNDPAIVSSSATKRSTPGAVDTQKATAGKAKSPESTELNETTNTLSSQKVSSGSSTGSKKLGKESFRLNAQSEINSLKEFSVSFKVPHKMPNDLIPILAKDKSKQDEILKKQDLVLAANVENSKDLPKHTEKSADSRKLSVSSIGTTGSTKEVKLFKLNPKAAAFTPSRPLQASPLLSNAATVTSPRVQTPKLPGSYNTRDRKHHVLSAVEIFGSAENVPTAEDKKKKLQRFRQGFNVLSTAVKEHESKTEKSSAPIFPRMFITPPTWDSTVDESYEKVITDKCLPQLHQGTGSHPGMQFMGSQMMVGGGVGGAVGNVPGAPGGYGAIGAGKFPVSPAMQNSMAAAQFQQQQMQAAMFYQQFQGAGGRPAPQMMYMAPGSDPQYLAPGFMVPGMMTAVHGHISPTYAGGDMGYGGVGVGGVPPLLDGQSNGYSYESRGHGHNHGHNHNHSSNHGNQNHNNHNNHGNYNNHGNQSGGAGQSGNNGREYSGNGYNGQGQGNRRYYNQKRTYNN